VTAALQQGPAAPAGGQQGPRVVQVDKIRDNLYVMKGGGGNSAVFITSTGVVVADTKNPGWGQPLLDGIKTVTDKPVTTIINTHTHGGSTRRRSRQPGVTLSTEKGRAAEATRPETNFKL